MMLPTRVQGYQGGDGQSSPYSVLGRMPGSNPEVQWVFVVRQYSIKKENDPDLDKAGDIAVIGHHPRTGATAFFQYYEPANPRSANVIVSPFSDGASEFWPPVGKLAAEFRCERCHSADAFIHTPWINQVRVRKVGQDKPFPEPMVPSSPLGPYFFVDSGPGEPFECWNYALKHLNAPKNKCTECHRITPYDLAGLGQNATRYAGLNYEDRNEFAVASDGFQTDTYYDLPWMPPVDSTSFYAGQAATRPNWQHDYETSAAEANRLTMAGDYVIDNPKLLLGVDDSRLVDVPRPPPEYATIVVDRPKRDRIEPNRSLWIVDTRMRANTDGDLHRWKFFGKGPTNNSMLAAPVVYRRKPTRKSGPIFQKSRIE